MADTPTGSTGGAPEGEAGASPVGVPIIDLNGVLQHLYEVAEEAREDARTFAVMKARAELQADYLEHLARLLAGRS